MVWSDGDALSPTNLNNQGGSVANPLAWGANSGGTVDSLAAFYSAVSSAAAAGGGNGGAVLVTPGTYYVKGNPFHNRINVGNAPMVVELFGAKISSDSQIKIPTSTIVRGSNRLRCGFKSTGSFIGSVGISSIARSSNTVTVTTLVDHGLPDNATSVISGVAGAGFNGGYPIYSVTSRTFKYNNVGADAAGSGGTLYVPFVVLGSTDSFDLGTRLECLNIDCSSSATSTVGLYTGNANELSGAENILIQQAGPVSLWIDDGPGTGVAINYRFENIEILPQALGTNTAVLVNAVASGQHRGLDNITVTPISSGGTIRAAFSINAPGLYTRLHPENCTYGVIVGERGNTTVTSSNTDSAGISIIGVTAGGSPGVTNLVYLSNTSEVHDVFVSALARRGSGTNVFVDDRSGFTSTKNWLAVYATGSQAQPTRFTTDAGMSWRVNNSIRATDGYFTGTTVIGLVSGSGSPEGSVIGNIGHLYARSDGTPGHTLYVKETGSGNTGWIEK